SRRPPSHLPARRWCRHCQMSLDLFGQCSRHMTPVGLPLTVCCVAQLGDTAVPLLECRLVPKLPRRRGDIFGAHLETARDGGIDSEGRRLSHAESAFLFGADRVVVDQNLYSAGDLSATKDVPK